MWYSEQAMGWTVEESVDSGHRWEIFLSPKEFRLTVGTTKSPIHWV